MKKTICTVFILILSVMTLIACNKESGEEETGYVLSFDAYYDVVSDVIIESSNGETDESASRELEAMAGQKIGDVLKEFDIVNIEAQCEEGYEFEGWLEYEITIAVDKEGYEFYQYELVSADKIYTFEEILEAEMPDHHVAYIAKWAEIPVEDYDPGAAFADSY